MTIGKLVLVGVAVLTAIVVAIEYPEIHRYIKMETM
jgi:hypothetical protein